MIVTWLSFYISQGFAIELNYTGPSARWLNVILPVQGAFACYLF